jgi:hypothetical protein
VTGMNIAEIKEAFQQCEYPFYKNVTIEKEQASCTLYSIYSDVKLPVKFNLSDFATLVHQISLQVIKIRSQEIKEQRRELVEQCM